MEFSIMFWGDAVNCENARESYDLMLRIARYADDNRYAGVWIPERHFNLWGGLHPNPSVFAAALAVTTKNLKIRAGSVVLPLHSPFRVAEEWSLVDNLSEGRVELAFATGWKDDDFILAPENYKDRRQNVWQLAEDVSRLWQGESLSKQNGNGAEVSIMTYPRPVQKKLPVWITSGGSLRTISDAGQGGYNLLTHLLSQDYDGVGKKIEQYKMSRLRSGLSSAGKIALMVHTLVGKDKLEMKELARPAMRAYLLNSVNLIVPAMARSEWDALDNRTKDEMVEIAFDRYFEGASLMGSIESCKLTLKNLVKLGVTEICCLIDFGLPLEIVLDHMSYLTELKDWSLNGGL